MIGPSRAFPVSVCVCVCVTLLHYQAVLEVCEETGMIE